MTFVREMRNNGRHIDFIGLTGTLLSDGSHGTASLITDALRCLPARDPAFEPETLEMLQIALSAETHHELKAAAECSGVTVLLSRPDGPALSRR